jgi:hypothetical protein
MKTSMKTLIVKAAGLVQFVHSRRDLYKAIAHVEDLHRELREKLAELPSVKAKTEEEVRADKAKAEHERKKSATLTIANVLENEGFMGFYKGVSSGLVSYAATWSTYYYAYHRVRATLRARGPPTTLGNLANSTFAGVVTCIVTNPLWVVNTRMKLQSKTRKSGWTLVELQRMIAEEGISSCFKGLGASLVLVTNPAIQFLLVEKFDDLLKARGYTDATLTPLHRFVVGAISKLISTLVTYPLQVVKTRQQESKNSAKAVQRAADDGASADGALANPPPLPRAASAAAPTDSETDDGGAGASRGRGMRRTVVCSEDGSPRLRMKRSAAGASKYSGSQIAIVLAILRREGIGGLYRGLGVKIVQTVLTSAFLMAFQDATLKLLARLVAGRARLR